MDSHHPSNPTSNDAAKMLWLTVEDIRKMQRMRRSTVIEAMNNGNLPYEQRGRIRYARLCDVIKWEENRIAYKTNNAQTEIDSDFLNFL